MTIVNANGQEIIGPSPAHFIHPQSGHGTGIGLALATVPGEFGPVRILQVCAAHRHHPGCSQAAKALGSFTLN
jgi:hypothetical protein